VAAVLLGWVAFCLALLALTLDSLP
jgi:hypothetical protein